MRYRACHKRTLAYHEQCLPAPQRHEAETHLQECARCRLLLAELQETDRLLRGNRPAVESLSPAASSAVLAAALSQSGARQAGWPRWWGFGPLAVSLGCLWMLATTAGIQPPSHQAPAAVAQARVAALAPGMRPAEAVRPAPGPALTAQATPATGARRRRARQGAGRRGPAAQPAVRLVAARESRVEAPAALPAPAVEEPVSVPAPQPAGELLLVINEAPRLEIEVSELPSEAPGEACASSAVQDAQGRVTQKEVRVSGDDPEPQVVLIGDGRVPGPVN